MMRRTISLIMTAALVLGAFAAPATAAKKKKKKKPQPIHETFAAQAVPFPNLSSSTGTARPGCSAGEEGVHWVGVDFEAPYKGELRFYIEGFTGDWDLYLYEGDTVLHRSDQAQVPDMAPPEEELVLSLAAKQSVKLVVCNWFGEPEVEAHYEYKPAK